MLPDKTKTAALTIHNVTMSDSKVVSYSVFAISAGLIVLALGLFSVTRANDDVAVDTQQVGSTASSPLDVPVLSAVINPNPQGFRGGAEIMVTDGALVATGPVGADAMAEARVETGEISVYTVRSGDTLSHIAEMYGVTANTILWANDLARATDIQEGQTLVILPVVGVQHTVKKGDTLAQIAKKYDADVAEIRSHNQLAAGDELTVGSTILVPGGTIKAAPVVSPVKGGAKSGKNWLAHPTPGAIKTQGIHGYNAVDFAAAVGTTIRAAAAGEVIVSKSSGWNGGYGQYIVIRHSNGAQTLYAHLSANSVSVGATVAQGEVIGAMGNTGRSTGPHLHFEVRGATNPF